VSTRDKHVLTYLLLSLVTEGAMRSLLREVISVGGNTSDTCMYVCVLVPDQSIC
jgi:hypothetical protein